MCDNYLFKMLFGRLCQVVVVLTSLMVSRNSVTCFRNLRKRQESGICPDNWLLHNKFCFTHIPLKTTYDRGKQTCKNHFKEAVPATIRSNEDLDSIKGHFLILDTDVNWIGLRKEQGTFMIWEDGSRSTYRSFENESEASSFPNRNCVATRSDGKWFPSSCTELYYTYCSVPASGDLCENIKCHDYATCYNTFISYVCVCNDGYAGDGISSCIESPGCPDDQWKEHKGMCYREVLIISKYEEAQLICKNDFNGSDLAKLRYEGDQDFIASSFQGTFDYWIGLRKRNLWTDTLTWEDNSTVTYRAFALIDPRDFENDKCVFTNRLVGWYDTDCEISLLQTICSIDATKWVGAGTNGSTKFLTRTVTVVGGIVLVLLIAISVFVAHKKFSIKKRDDQSQDQESLKQSEI